MDTRRRCILFLVLLVGLWGPAGAQETAPAPAEEAARAEVGKQIRIYKTTLLEGKDAQTRLDAATLLLFNGNGEARAEVLSVLRDESHPEARAAICKALTVAREDRKQVANKEEFIEPLVAVLSTEKDHYRAELAAQAFLMFTYDAVRGQLERLASDPNSPKTARVNAVRTLKYQPDERAIYTLVDLLGGSDAEIAAESKEALKLLGIDVPSDPNGTEALIERLKRRGPEAYLKNPMILRNWLLSREQRIQELTTALASWEQKYLAALGRLYDAQTDEKSRSELLSQQLKSPESNVKLWVLGKLEELRQGTGKRTLSPELEGMLLGLISHRDKAIRLATANLLTLMRELDSTKQLLAQLQVEEDGEVKHGLFVALGYACYYASQPASSVKVSEDVRRQTLELAVAFLGEADAEKARSGADVIRMLLEQDGLEPAEVDKYLTALAERYRQANPGANEGLRGELLGAMAGLCGQRSVDKVRTRAATLYGLVFEEGLGDGVESVRQAAVDGLTNIDRSAALRRLRADFPNDPSAAIRVKVVDLAGEIGGPDDLEWLSKKLGAPGEGEAAWQAMQKILRRSGTDVMDAWASRFETSTGPNGLSPGQRISFLTLFEQKIRGENKPAKLRDVRVKLFALYAAGGDPARTTEYMTLVLGGAATNEREAASVALLEACLRLPGSGVNLAGEIVSKCLSEKDIGSSHPLAKSIERYLKTPPAGADPSALLARLRQIEIKEPGRRPLWSKLLVEWEAFAKANKPAAIEKANN